MNPYDVELMLDILSGYTLTFGKHKGKTLWQVRADNFSYLAWLARQEWTAEKYPEIIAFTDAVKAEKEYRCAGTMNGEPCTRTAGADSFCHAHRVADNEGRGLDLVTCKARDCDNAARESGYCGTHKRGTVGDNRTGMPAYP